MILLLTGCINPNGMTMTALSNQEERKSQYINAIRYYLSNTSFQIVFTDNSNTDISPLFKKAIESGRMEYLTFNGNHDKERGKGYGECEIIEYALNHSELLRSACNQRIIKITGRLIVKNITRITKWHSVLFPKRTVFCAINSDLSFPDSRVVIASIGFWIKFLYSKEKINDSKGYYFEHALCDTLKREKDFPYSPFLIMPMILGCSGTTGKEYTFSSESFSFSYKYAKYAFSLKNLFKKRYRITH